jgi:hypothetical protein
MNELEFKRRLKDLVHGHPHPEDHAGGEQPNAPKEASHAKSTGTRRRASGKPSKNESK